MDFIDKKIIVPLAGAETNTGSRPDFQAILGEQPSADEANEDLADGPHCYTYAEGGIYDPDCVCMKEK